MIIISEEKTTVLSQERAAYEAKLAEAQEAHTAELAAEREAHEALLTAERDSHAEKTAEALSKLNARFAEEWKFAEQLATERDGHAAKLVELQEAHEAKLAAERAKYFELQESQAKLTAQRFAEEGGSFQAMLEQERESFNTRLEEARAMAAEEKEVCEGRLAKELEARETRLAEEQKAQEARLVEQRQSHVVEMAMQRDAHAADLTKERGAYELMLAKQQDAHAVELAEERKLLADRLAEELDVCGAKASIERQAYERQLAEEREAREASEAKLAQEQQQHEASLTQESERREVELGKEGEALAARDATELEASMARLIAERTKLESAMLRKEQALACSNTALEEHLAQAQAVQACLLAELQTTDVDHGQMGFRSQADSEDQIKALRDALFQLQATLDNDTQATSRAAEQLQSACAAQIQEAVSRGVEEARRWQERAQEAEVGLEVLQRETERRLQSMQRELEAVVRQGGKREKEVATLLYLDRPVDAKQASGTTVGTPTRRPHSAFPAPPEETTGVFAQWLGGRNTRTSCCRSPFESQETRPGSRGAVGRPGARGGCSSAGGKSSRAEGVKSSRSEQRAGSASAEFDRREGERHTFHDCFAGPDGAVCTGDEDLLPGSKCQSPQASRPQSGLQPWVKSHEGMLPSLSPSRATTSAQASHNGSVGGAAPSSCLVLGVPPALPNTHELTGLKVLERPHSQPVCGTRLSRPASLSALPPRNPSHGGSREFNFEQPPRESMSAGVMLRSNRSARHTQAAAEAAGVPPARSFWAVDTGQSIPTSDLPMAAIVRAQQEALQALLNTDAAAALDRLAEALVVLQTATAGGEHLALASAIRGVGLQVAADGGKLPALVAPTRHDVGLLLAHLLAYNRPGPSLDPSLMPSNFASIRDGAAVARAEEALAETVKNGASLEQQRLAEGALRYRRLELEVAELKRTIARRADSSAAGSATGGDDAPSAICSPRFSQMAMGIVQHEEELVASHAAARSHRARSEQELQQLREQRLREQLVAFDPGDRVRTLLERMERAQVETAQRAAYQAKCLRQERAQLLELAMQAFCKVGYNHTDRGYFHTLLHNHDGLV